MCIDIILVRLNNISPLLYLPSTLPKFSTPLCSVTSARSLYPSLGSLELTQIPLTTPYSDSNCLRVVYSLPKIPLETIGFYCMSKPDSEALPRAMSFRSPGYIVMLPTPPVPRLSICYRIEALPCQRET